MHASHPFHHATMDRCIPTLEAALKPKGPFGGGPFLNSPGPSSIASHRFLNKRSHRCCKTRSWNDQTTSQNKRVLSIKKKCLKLKNQCFCLEKNKTCTISFSDIPPWGKVFYVFWWSKYFLTFGVWKPQLILQILKLHFCGLCPSVGTLSTRILISSNEDVNVMETYRSSIAVSGSLDRW